MSSLLKPVEWIGSSRNDLQEFPEDVQLKRAEEHYKEYLNQQSEEQQHD